MADIYEESPGGGIEDAPRREKALMQLNWVDITIKAMPGKGGCCATQGALKVERTIIDCVSGAVLPG